LDLSVKQAVRLTEACAKRNFTTKILAAQLQELALLRSLGTAFGGESSKLPSWPRWEESAYKQTGVDDGPMSRFKKKALKLNE
jgi:hypothetical protein